MSADGIAYHAAHKPYIKAVMDALNEAGIGTGGWEAEPNDPRNGYIDLARSVTSAVYGGSEVCLLWSEERGWSIGWGAPVAWAGFDWFVHMSAGVLPSPAVVVEAVRWAVTEKPGPAKAHDSFSYRAAGDEGGFEATLASYHPADDPPMRSDMAALLDSANDHPWSG